MSKPGRNDPCPCGSGLKFKKCCGSSTPPDAAPSGPVIEVSESARKSGWLNYPTPSYARLMHDVNLTEDLAFWTLCARQFGSPVLCLASGLGREAIHLAQQGIPTVGIDIHQGFVEAAQDQKRMKAETLKADLQFQVADMVSMQLNQKFPLAIMATLSFQLLLTEADQRSFLRSLHVQLNDKGVFVFDINRVTMEGKRFVNGEGERMGVYATDLDRVPRFLTHGPLSQRLSTLEETKALLASCGFEVFCVQGSPENIAGDFLEKNAPVPARETEYTIFARKI